MWLNIWQKILATWCDKMPPRFALWLRNQWCMDHSGASAQGQSYSSFGVQRGANCEKLMQFLFWHLHCGQVLFCFLIYYVTMCLLFFVVFYCAQKFANLCPVGSSHFYILGHWMGWGACGAWRDGQQRLDLLHVESFTSWTTASWAAAAQNWSWMTMG